VDRSEGVPAQGRRLAQCGHRSAGPRPGPGPARHGRHPLAPPRSLESTPYEPWCTCAKTALRPHDAPSAAASKPSTQYNRAPRTTPPSRTPHSAPGPQPWPLASTPPRSIAPSPKIGPAVQRARRVDRRKRPPIGPGPLLRLRVDRSLAVPHCLSLIGRARNARAKPGPLPANCPRKGPLSPNELEITIVRTHRAMTLTSS